jgi:hypothetical protein
MIVQKILTDASFQPDLTGLENWDIQGYSLNEDGETYTVQAVHKLIPLIRKRYSIDDEIAIQRQKETKPEQFQAYFDYVELCKTSLK